MTDIKIKKGKNRPDPEKIRKHKDFGRLMNDYEKATKPLYKRLLYRDKRGFLAVLLIILAIVLIIEFMDESDDQKKTPVPKQDSIENPVSKTP